MRTTYTYAVIDVPRDVYDLLARIMHDNGYDHVIDDEGNIDMSGFAINSEKEKNDE